MQRSVFIRGAGAVLAGGILSGRAALTESRPALTASAGQNALSGFDPKPYLGTVKGYLDEIGKYALAAAALALGEERERLSEGGERVGVVSATRWGATGSGFRFFQQAAQKGPRAASPLVFPHSYPNTAGNLVAMEYGFAGPHMVYLGAGGARESLHFAAATLAGNDACHVLALVCEAVQPGAVPETLHAVNGAIALWLTAETGPALATLSLADLDAAPPPAAEGSVADWAQCLSTCTAAPTS